LSSSIFPSGLSSSAFAATTAATADAAEPPSPDPSGMPLSMNASKPKPGFNASCIASSARPAVLRSGSRGMSFTTPEEPEMVTPGFSVRVTVHLSPMTSTENPRMSKPMATFAAEAGAKAVAFVLAGAALTGAPRDSCRRAAGRRTRPRP
jgi:hypothetical protein